ncbi:hypothetical protein SAMN06265379_1145 [Saccharicrinis carchari]|uniref:ParB-like nuclease domain-containing protein n=1 Tax=Saccharicrinis carchari TaxID=1168039 RepID=A0A521F3I8_SACCC|nr:hypothetical protein [Saccharicrinis carchari]SMO90717.1 hypothetical protein SAMN06265379_1145 [Saccharicrinis carchari]
MAKKLGLKGGLGQFRSEVKELTALPELERLIPPLTTEEYKNLEESILELGVETPLDVWIPTEKTAGGNKDIIGKTIIVDGHNRNIIRLKHKMPVPKTTEREFNSLVEVKNWMLKKQLGRRNLSDANRTYLTGLLYNTSKYEKGKYERNFDGEIERNTAHKISQETGSSIRSVKNAGDFADGINKLAPELKKHILSGKERIAKATIQELASSDAEKPIENIEQIEKEVKKVRQRKTVGKKKKQVSEKNSPENGKTIKSAEFHINKNDTVHQEMGDGERLERYLEMKAKFTEQFGDLELDILTSVFNDILQLRSTQSDHVKLANDGYTILRSGDSPKIHIKYFSKDTNSWKILENTFTSKTERDRRFKKLLKNKKTIRG